MVRRTTTREAEFVAFVSSSARYLARTAYLLTGDTDVANDLVQESLTRTYAAWRRVRPGDAKAYVRRILVNLNTDRWRRRTSPRWNEHAAGDVGDLHRFHWCAGHLQPLTEARNGLVARGRAGIGGRPGTPDGLAAEGASEGDLCDLNYSIRYVNNGTTVIPGLVHHARRGRQEWLPRISVPPCFGHFAH